MVLTNVAPKYYKAPNNAQILAAIHKNASNTYQSRVPEATQASIQATQEHLLTNRPDWNEFVDALVNRIGLNLFKIQQFKNPLAKFINGDLNYGDTIEEIAYGLAEAYAYDEDRDYLEKVIFGQERPDVRAAYHKINSKNFYKLTINEVALRRAFDSPMGLSDYIAGQMTILANSDELDTYVKMASLFKEYYDNGGFFKVNVPNIGADASTAADAKVALRKVRAFADRLTFLSTHYNAVGLPVRASRDDLELFITPEASAALDVEALAGAFNSDRMEMPTRITIVPAEDFRIPGVQMVLSTRDFFVCANSWYEITQQKNPAGLYENHFLHHHMVLSTSLFVPAILFYTGPGDTITLDVPEIEGVNDVTLTNRNGVDVTTVERGEVYAIDGSAITDPENGYNGAVRFEFATRPGSTHTLIRQENRSLYVGVDEPLRELTIRAVSVEDNSFVKETTFQVTGSILTLYPNPNEQPDADNDGLIEVTPDEPEQVGNVVTIPTTNAAAVTYSDGTDDFEAGEDVTLTENETITAAANDGYEIADGATASWDYTYTA